MFRLFSYGRCQEFTKENYDLTRRWMRYTTALTRYEARVCMARHDFSKYEKMLDVGGNSGEFALQVCKKNPRIRAAVFDLPVVCDIGLEHVRNEPEAERISFFRGDALADPLPGGFDLITFKSVLHDWPDREAEQFIRRAAEALNPGGTLLIFERGPVEIGERQPPYSIIPFLLFSHSFRSPAFYEELLNAMGFMNISHVSVNLEMRFFILSAISPR
jgi:ubiquinone/menaquinone biosynthesis C-methylase UbiE